MKMLRISQIVLLLFLGNCLSKKQAPGPRQAEDENTLEDGDDYESEENPFQTRIANGRSVHIGEMSYHLQLRHLDQHRCGAGLVEADNGVQIVVTAGQCITNRADDTVYPANQFDLVGGRILRDGTHPYEQFRKVTKIHRWSTWKRTWSLFYNDMALLTIDKPFTVDRLVRPVKMPWRGSVHPEGKIIVGGWGQTSHTSPDSFSEDLQITTLDYVGWDQCKKTLSYEITAELQNSNFCAGKVPTSVYRGACLGDRGAPAIAIFNRTAYLAGVFSYNHKGCGNRYMPNVFEDLSFYISWVNDVAKESTGRRKKRSVLLGPTLNDAAHLRQYVNQRQRRIVFYPNATNWWGQPQTEDTVVYDF